MDLKGSREIAADRQTVWRALNDPEVLKACIPGCQELTGTPGEGFEATVRQKVGPVSATFKGAVSLSNVVPGESYTISGEGKGGAAGFAKGAADVRLEDAEGGGTRLGYDVKASVGGKLAQLGSRVIDGFAKKMADQFFENFKTEVERPEAAGAGAVAASPEAPAAPVPDPGAPSGGAPGGAGVAPKAGAPRQRPAAPPSAAAGEHDAGSGAATASGAPRREAPAATGGPVPDPGAPSGGAPGGAGAAPKAGAPRQGPASPASAAAAERGAGSGLAAASASPGGGLLARIAAWFRRVVRRG